jgi:hypothetical protein
VCGENAELFSDKLGGKYSYQYLYRIEPRLPRVFIDLSVYMQGVSEHGEYERSQKGKVFIFQLFYSFILISDRVLKCGTRQQVPIGLDEFPLRYAGNGVGVLNAYICHQIPNR